MIKQVLELLFGADPELRQIIGVTLRMSVLSTLISALIGIPYSYEAARSYADTNVMGTLNVLEAARETLAVVPVEGGAAIGLGTTF